MGEVVRFPSRKPLGPMTCTAGIYGPDWFNAPGVFATVTNVGCRKCAQDVSVALFTCGCSATGQSHRAWIVHPCAQHQVARHA